MNNAIQFLYENKNFTVRYNAPTRKFNDFRTECYNDAAILKSHGPVYVSFSSGVDSQIIAKCFIDQGVDAEYVFLHSVGHNDQEYHHVLECEKFFNIKVRKFDINIDDFKDEWISRSQLENPPRMHQYPFEYLSKILPNDYPIVFQGMNEPAILGSGKKVSVYHNYYDNMHIRIKFMSKYRKVLDFPFSPEAIASYYTDNIVKGFCHSLRYINENNLHRYNLPVQKAESFEYFCKPILKGYYFKDDLIWYGKTNGSETYPSWITKPNHIRDTRVSVPYWDLVDFLENNRETYKDYNEWIFDKNIPGFESLK